MAKTYGQRLTDAMEHAGLTQTVLAVATGLSQPTISYLASPKNTATGSEFTPRLARVCGVSVDWLADEIGEMLPTYFTTTDPKIIAVARVMEPLSEYAKDAAVKDVTQIAELVERAKANGTDG